MHINRRLPLFGLAITCLFIAACEKEAPPVPIIEVVVADVTLQPFRPTTTFVGRLQAKDDVQIQAKVTGYLQARNFHEGDLVEAGDLLYAIDPAPFKAELAKAKAEFAKARASVKVAERNFARGKELLPKGAISASEMDKIEAEKLQADADVQGAIANRTSAEVSLSYTNVMAPISGRIGRSEPTVGDLIGPDSGSLTSLVSIDPMKAIFQVSEALYLANERRRRQAGLSETTPHFNVKLELSDRGIYAHPGEIDYISNRIDENTGTIEARASIPNPDGALRPGQYVKVILEVPFEIETLMLPQSAVQADQQGSFVMAVGVDSKVVRHNVVLSQRVADKVIVQGGIEEGEQVIVRGLQKVRPGQVVKVTRLSNKEG